MLACSVANFCFKSLSYGVFMAAAQPCLDAALHLRDSSLGCCFFFSRKKKKKSCLFLFELIKGITAGAGLH